jgi:ferric enterobactin receptor
MILNMKIFLTLCVFGIFSVTVKAQNTKAAGGGKISGKVTDATTKQVVDYATISVFKQGSTSPFNGASSDPKGNFTVDNIPNGDYRVTIDFLGYTKKVLDHVIVANGANLSLGNVLVTPAQNQLKEVSVTAQAATVENKIDKMVYNPANDLTSQGGVALDVLKKVPMITVDIDGNVELMGNSNIRFLINGKPSSIFGASLADALQSIPSSQIKSIEVVTSPGAKYDAAGTGGIINIVLKDSKVQGFNGNVNLSAGTRFENGSLNLNARKGNFGINTFFSGNEQLNTTAINTNDRSSTDVNGNSTRLFQKGSSAFKRSGYRSGLSLSWDITPKDLLTASFGFNHFGNNNSGITAQDQTTSGALFSPIDTLSLRNSSSRFNANSADYSLSYKKNFAKEGQELDVLYNASFGNNTSNFMQQQDYTNVTYPSTGSIGNNPGKDRETDISVDYTQPVNKSITIETGAKAVIENLNNTVSTQTLTNGVYAFNPGQSYSFNYKRNIFAYYLSSSFSMFNNFIDGKAGLRYEYTKSNADFPNTTIPSYGILAPSFALSHKLDKTQTIKFSYTYRLQRPEYRDLNPFYNISDPHNINTGNPNLRPELGHNYELGYNKSFDKGANIYVAAFYRYNTDDIQSFTTFYNSLKVGDTTYSNVSLNQRYNIGSEKNLGINIYGSLPLGDKLSIRTNMFFADRITNNPGTPQVSGFAYRINLNGSYNFGHDLAAEFFINYRSSQKGIQGTSPAFSFYNLAVRKQFMNKKASIGLTAANPFAKYVYQTSTTFGTNFNQTNIRQIPFQSFGISLTYKFGKLEFKKNKEDNNNNAPDVAGDSAGK